MTITSTATDAWRSADSKTLTLKAYGPVGSTFSTGRQTIIVSNNSNIDADLVKLEVAAPTDNDKLKAGIYVKIETTDTKTPVYDGLLADLESSDNPLIAGQTIKAGSSKAADVTFYAGGTRPTLPDGAQGGVVIPTFKVAFTG
jgi:hypothetical protein